MKVSKRSGRLALCDTGPLVAYFDKDDQWHDLSRALLDSWKEPIATVLPVVTEAMYLLRDYPTALHAISEMVASEACILLPIASADFARINELMVKYEELPMDFADACLVRVAERERIKNIFTLDQVHFSLYRPKGIKYFRLLPEMKIKS